MAQAKISLLFTSNLFQQGAQKQQENKKGEKKKNVIPIFYINNFFCSPGMASTPPVNSKEFIAALWNQVTTATSSEATAALSMLLCRSTRQHRRCQKVFSKRGNDNRCGSVKKSKPLSVSINKRRTARKRSDDYNEEDVPEDETASEYDDGNSDESIFSSSSDEDYADNGKKKKKQINKGSSSKRKNDKRDTTKDDNNDNKEDPSSKGTSNRKPMTAAQMKRNAAKNAGGGGAPKTNCERCFLEFTIWPFCGVTGAAHACPESAGSATAVSSSSTSGK